MSVLRQIRVSFSDGKAVGVDGDSSEILKSITWSVLQKIRKTFEMKDLGVNKEIETLLKNIALIPKKKIINKLDMDRQDEFAFRVSWASGIVDVSPAWWRWS